MRIIFIYIIGLVVFSVGSNFIFAQNDDRAPSSMFPKPELINDTGSRSAGDSGFRFGSDQGFRKGVDSGYRTGNDQGFRIGGDGGGGFQINNPLGGINTIQDLVNRLINALIILATPVVVIMVLWGGFKIMTSAGDPKKYTDGGKVILYAAVGYGVLLLAKGVTAIIESIVYDII